MAHTDRYADAISFGRQGCRSRPPSISPFKLPAWVRNSRRSSLWSRLTHVIEKPLQKSALADCCQRRRELRRGLLGCRFPTAAFAGISLSLPTTRSLEGMPFLASKRALAAGWAVLVVLVLYLAGWAKSRGNMDQRAQLTERYCAVSSKEVRVWRGGAQAQNRTQRSRARSSSFSNLDSTFSRPL